MGTLHLQNCVLLVKKVPKRTPRKSGKFRNSAPQTVLCFILKSVSVFSHGGVLRQEDFGNHRKHFDHILITHLEARQGRQGTQRDIEGLKS